LSVLRELVAGLHQNKRKYALSGRGKRSLLWMNSYQYEEGYVFAWTFLKKTAPDASTSTVRSRRWLI
jgi:hypothetical protein